MIYFFQPRLLFGVADRHCYVVFPNIIGTAMAMANEQDQGKYGLF